MILALPVVNQLKLSFPSAHFTLMVKEEHRPVFYKYADSFYKPLSKESLYRLKDNFDLVFNIEYSYPPRYKPKKFSSKQVNYIGSADWDSKKLHIYKHLLGSFKDHGLPVKYRSPKIYLTDDAKIEAQRWLDENGISKKDFNVVVNPTSGFRKKMWNVKKFIKVCKWLVKEYDAKILVIAKTKRERASIQLYNSLPQSNRNFLLNKPLDILSAVISKYDLSLGNDSGTSHLASVMGVPTVAIFALTSPGLWKPPGRKTVTVYIPNKCRCKGYEKAKRCKNQVCLKSITPTHVEDGILLCINKFVKRERKPSLDRIKISDHIEILKMKKGIIVSNKKTNHSFLIDKGFRYISKIFDFVSETNSYTAAIKKYPGDKQLLDFLILHRTVVAKKK